MFDEISVLAFDPILINKITSCRSNYNTEVLLKSVLPSAVSHELKNS